MTKYAGSCIWRYPLTVREKSGTGAAENSSRKSKKENLMLRNESSALTERPG